MSQDKQTHKPASISGDDLILAIGILSALLPFVVYFSVEFFFPWDHHRLSLSEYFYTSANPLFVGILFAIGFVMLFYRGYAKNDGPIPLSDNQLATITGICAILVAIFPSNTCAGTPPELFNAFRSQLASWVHFISAGGVFASVAVFFLFYFTQTGGISADKLSTNKRVRNAIYRICGVVIILGLLTLAYVAYSVRNAPTPICEITNPSRIVFYVETIMLVAMSVGWLTKFAGRIMN